MKYKENKEETKRSTLLTILVAVVVVLLIGAIAGYAIFPAGLIWDCSCFRPRPPC